MSSVLAFVERFEPRLTFPILIEPAPELHEQWGIRGLPKTAVIDKQGRIIYEAEGGRDMDSPHIRSLLLKLIARP